MISERKFASTFSSFWGQLLPMGKPFVRRLNLACERQVAPTISKMPVDREKRSVINELSFRLFKEQTEQGEKVSTSKLNMLSSDVIKYIERLSFSIPEILPLTKSELEESVQIANALPSFFYRKDLPKLIFWPSFKGCGSIHSCKGDIIFDDTLVEVKAGDRHFGINDVRQILTYLALNFSSQQYDLNNIALINPRTGLSFTAPVRTIVEECSGRLPTDVFLDIIEFISNEVGSN